MYKGALVCYHHHSMQYPAIPWCIMKYHTIHFFLNVGIKAKRNKDDLLQRRYIPVPYSTVLGLGELGVRGPFLLARLVKSSRVASVRRVIPIFSLPDICHGRHGRCPCRFFLAGVNFVRCNAKDWPSYCTAVWFETFCVRLHNVCNATQCMILYTVCNLHDMCDYTHSNFTKRCVFL